MEGALWLLFVLAVVVVVALVCRLLGLGGGQAIAFAGIALVGTLLAMGGLVWAALAECWFENRPRPLSWPWSPRREFCSEPGSPAALGAYPLLALPALAASLGAFLWSKRHRGLAAGAFCLIAVSPFLPSLYASALPYYRLDSYPILHNPYVRPASDQWPARVCYAYGVVHGPALTRIENTTERVCADLKSTQEARELVPEYESLPSYPSIRGRVEWLGKNLTENGMEPGTEYDGLVAERVYRLPGLDALEGSFFIRTL
jgi:hypothetical protein